MWFRMARAPIHVEALLQGRRVDFDAVKALQKRGAGRPVEFEELLVFAGVVGAFPSSSITKGAPLDGDWLGFFVFIN